MSAAPGGSFNLQRDAIVIPDGFKPMLIGVGGDFISVNGPLYIRHEGALVQLGLRVERRHCNPMGNCHGGMLASFGDMVLPMCMHRKAPEIGNKFLPTINLQLDYLAPAPLGAWLTGEAEVLRITRSMVFGQGLIRADGLAAVRISGIFKIGKEFPAAMREGG